MAYQLAMVAASLATKATGWKMGLAFKIPVRVLPVTPLRALLVQRTTPISARPVSKAMKLLALTASK